MKKLLTTLFTLFFSALAFADNGTSIPSAPASDISISLLGQLFGTVGGVLQGTSGDMLGQMFYKFNQGVFVVAGMFIIYTTSTMVLRSATEGSFMGSDKKSGWFTMLRIPLGLALLMPVPSTGYETYQSVVMGAVIQGVNLADSTWSWALNYLNAGGVVYLPPSRTADNTGNAVGSPNYTNQLNLAQFVMAGLTCMEITNIVNTSAPGGSSAQTFSVITDDVGFNLLFPGGTNTPPGTNLPPSSMGCGYISWDFPVANIGSTPICDSTNTNTNAPMACSLAQAAAQQLVLDLQAAAKTYACGSNIPGNNGSYCEGQSANPDKDGIAATAIANAMIDYENLMLPLGYIVSGSVDGKYKNFINQAKNDGWIMAGRYYWDISLLNDQYANANSGVLPVPTAGGQLQTTSGSPPYQAAYKDITTTTEATGNIPYQVDQNITAYYNSQAKGPNALPSQNPTINGSGTAAQIVLVALAPMATIIGLFQNTGVNPIMFIHQLGVALLSMASAIWIGMSITIFVLYIVGFICESESPVGPALAGIVDWVKPILTVIIAMSFGTGMMLAYYVPLYPYIIFTFGTVGWFISVIEAMVAAPLVCFGLTHPEGHDFLGKAEQALMLLLAVFLRPVLMIIGLIAAMILSYVTLLLLNIGFGGVINSLYGAAGEAGGAQNLMDGVDSAAGFQLGAAGNPVIALVVIPSLLVIFTMLVYTIIQQCYSLIFVLPENILTWIGGPKSDSHAGQYAQQVEGAVSSAGKQMGEVVNAAPLSASTAHNTGRGQRADQSETKKEEKKNEGLAKAITGAMKGGGSDSGSGGGGAAPPV